MSEQLLDCHYIHPTIHQARSEGVPEGMPRHAVDSCLSTCAAEAGFEVNKRLSGLKIAWVRFS
jgi:hypothetical protein